MWPLISNELYKIIKKKKFWITFIVFFALFLAYSIVQYSSEKKYYEPKQRIAMDKLEIKTEKKQLNSPGINAEQKKKIKQYIKQDEKDIKDKKKEDASKDLDWHLRLNKELIQKKYEYIKDKGKGKNEDTEDASISVMKDEYYRDNNLNPYDKTGDLAMDSFLSSKAFMQILVVFIIIAVATSDIVSSEYSPATIKMLLAKPASRAKILFSKFIAILVGNIFIIGIPQVITYLILSFMNGFPNLSQPIAVGRMYQYDSSVILSNHNVGVSPILGSSYLITEGKYLLYLALLDLLFILGCVSICFLISVLIKNSAITIGINVGLGVVMSIIGLMTLEGAIPKALSAITPFLIMTYSSTDVLLMGDMAKRANNPGITVGMGIVVFIVYTVVCMGISTFVFSKKDMLA
ncbi:ABC-2 type transport system permease protein [Clostridium acetobutylicum]|uniref:Predicted permease n=1 Tax=Clostridium acetobutylicum (strain ATCC 824 / DSM 792 / JCM 1419 / IAM 19013 / LMG 5710 / NBRC 13948 / NRRL B-527 / VKM B-1787 / 2291 / W) TaxID=272562 RepID=Q97MQ3_CLOAB|nr:MULTISPECIES: ABC transporter permease [Clostridium]AAK78123.1 Predicted permease [Clostridium acetobutylicum ATCC 824]ADZ19182.1 permease [Clostridium acetobutylicum EA 2018]AEI31076.1 permease [Clostridium acetobutylicum DSM 1731]AWV81815.1 ABC transporter permease [Clostridium acetobutylicum]MBC2395361.1 ABC transporter permease [Clostridium acetobutylicum]